MVNPLISIIIPTYNRSLSVKNAVMSALHQTYKNIEIIVVDDGSQDNTSEIMQELVNNYSIVSYYQLKINQGPNYARNFGIKHGKGDFFGFLDSDDLWHPKKIELQMKSFLNSNISNIGLVYCWTLKRYENGRITFKTPSYQKNVIPPLLKENCIGGTSVALIKRQVFNKCGYFDESPVLKDGGAQDYEMWIRIAHNYNFEVVRNFLVLYNISINSISHQSQFQKPAMRIKAHLYLWMKYNDFLTPKFSKLPYISEIIGQSLMQLGNFRILKPISLNSLKYNPLNPNACLNFIVGQFSKIFPKLASIWNFYNHLTRISMQIPYYFFYWFHKKQIFSRLYEYRKYIK